MRKAVMATVAVSTLAGAVLAAGPASAGHCGSCWAKEGNTGEMVLIFNTKTWKALDSQMMVKPTGKAWVDGPMSFGFPARALDQDTVVTKGGLAFVRADAGLKVKGMVLDLANSTVTATVPGLGRDYDLFDLGNLKNGKRIKAKVNVAKGQAAELNSALKTDMFRDGMTLGKIIVE